MARQFKSTSVRTLGTSEFLNRFMEPSGQLGKVVKAGTKDFFIMDVQDLIRISVVPVPPTRATTHTMIFVTSGIVSMRIGFHDIRIGKNQCLIVPAGQLFSYSKYELNSGFLCVFDSTFINMRSGYDPLKEFEFLNPWSSPVIKPARKKAQHIINSLNRILDEYRENGLINRQIIQAYLFVVMLELKASYQPTIKPASLTAMKITKAFRDLLNRNFRSVQRVTNYASSLHVTPNHLNKMIRQATGKSPSRWIDETIITEAKILLFQTDDTISDIAMSLGIADQSYFSRLFKKYEGVTPLAFRKRLISPDL